MKNPNPNHTTHHACQEMLDKHGGKTVGCCCTGHECKQPQTPVGNMLKIKTSLQDDGDYREKDEFYINGERIGVGYYGGEREDNSKKRDYRWVAEIVQLVAERLGAEVEHERIHVTGEGFYED